MVIRIEDIRSCCADIVAAVDSNELSKVTEVLELRTNGNYLYMSVTNREYYAQVKLKVADSEGIHATVNANQFLKLMSLVTTEVVEFYTDDKALTVKANGVYKLPLIYDGDTLLEVPVINIDNVTNEFDVSSDILNSILQYNTKQLSVGAISRAVQRMYYVDDKGAITFTSGACVNNFTLPQPVKLLFNTRLVKLFKLFKGTNVHVVIGHDEVPGGIIQTKASFTTEDIGIVAILLADDSMISSVPVSAIRGRATADYPYSVNVNVNGVLDTIKRLLLFADNTSTSSYSVFEFGRDSVTVYDGKQQNKEIVKYNNDTSNIYDMYKLTLDLNDLKGVLESCNSQYVTLRFGDEQALLVCRPNVVNIIPEVGMFNVSKSREVV